MVFAAVVIIGLMPIYTLYIFLASGQQIAITYCKVICLKDSCIWIVYLLYVALNI